MGNPKGFMDIKRQEPGYRPARERLKDYNAVEKQLPAEEIRRQAERCMDCGIPFCHGCGCPLGNVIPEINELIYRGQWKDALELLSSTNRFPEFTGRVCPALCEAACTAGLNTDPVAIRQIELTLVEQAFAEGFIKPVVPLSRSGKKVAVIGSGPAGLAVADQLNQQGHAVVVFERDQNPGGLLRYGIPDFKLEKKIVERRINLLREEGINFETGVEVGRDISVAYLKKRYDAICVCCGARAPRDLPVPGRELGGIHFAMDFLRQQNCRVSAQKIEGPEISARGKHVVVIGGGDTGSDCVGTSLRQGAVSVTQIEIMPQPPEVRHVSTPWPQWPYQKRTSSSHLEGGERIWSAMTRSFAGEGTLQAVNLVKVEWENDASGRPVRFSEVPDSAFSLDAELVLLAMGFAGVERNDLLRQLAIKTDSKGNIVCDENGQTGEKGVFVAGDAANGPSLVVRALAGGRDLADCVDNFLSK